MASLFYQAVISANTMNIEDLNAFVWVARSGGYSRAAAVYRVAQSALSRRVARLESELGLQLLERDGRGVRLTDQGNLLLARADSIFAEIDAVKREMSDHADEPRGEVTLAMPPTTAQVLAPLIALEVAEQFPGIRLRLLEGFSGTIHHWAVSGQVDLALLYEPEERSDLSITALIDEPVFVIVAKKQRHRFPPLNGRTSVRLDDLPDLPLILPSKSHSIRSLIDRQAAERRLKLNIAFEVDGIRATRAMVLAGMGCTLFSYAGVYEDANTGDLEVIETVPPLSWTLSLCQHRQHHSVRAVQAVRGVVLNKIQALRKGGYWKGQFLFD